MSYTAPVSKEDVRKSENRFLVFFAISTIIFVGMKLSFCVQSLQSFWHQNQFWSVGSLIVFISVLQIRFFGIKANANPNSLNFSPNDFRTWVLNIEKCYSYVWVLGFILIGISRWVKI